MVIMKNYSLFLAALFIPVAALAEADPLRVFILAGQSNMQGHSQVRTFEHIGMDPATKSLLAEMQNADGSPKVCDRVWISSIGCAEAEQAGKLRLRATSQSASLYTAVRR